MKILILSPLFPPDVGTPAAYVKELLRRLDGHSVKALIYGYLPESVPGVAITDIDKRSWLMKRLVQYTVALLKTDADLIILNNAPSIELPLLFISLLKRNKIILCESDPLAQEAATKGFYKIIHTLTKKISNKIIILPEPVLYDASERLPFKEPDNAQAEARDRWWNSHVHELTSI